jgi:hypothetical protein
MWQLLNKPMAVGKIGSSECRAVDSVLNHTDLREIDLHDIFVGAGVFPPTIDSINSFFDVFTQHLKEMDVVAKWLGAAEEDMLNFYCPSAATTVLRDLEPYYWEEPWSKELKGKKVLVVSPFTETIKSQYKKRELLWKDERVLPSFTLKTIKCPLSWYLGEPTGTTWVDGLEDLKRSMTAVDFDVCLIGAGAWSIPLAVHAKRLGKIGIHLGGSLQILFGVKGGRWDDHDVISTFYNDAWVRPSGDEVPKEASRVEGGCYW